MTVKSRKIRKSGKLVYGFGVNDADYNVNPYVDGVRSPCPIYKMWSHILERALSDKFHQKNPTYIGCSVADEWKSFMNFKDWVLTKDWVGKQPDKDLLVKGNKHYSPDTVVFLSRSVNSFLSAATSENGLLTGVYKCSRSKTKPFRATYQAKLIGYFETEVEAHLAWKNKKHLRACELARLETCPIVRQALSERFSGDSIYENK